MKKSSPMNNVDHDLHIQKTSASPPKMPSSPNNLNKGSRPSSPISPPVVEFAKCNQQNKFWRSVTRSLKRYLTTCFKPMEKHSRNKHSSTEEASGFSNLQMSPNYYAEMNDEERAEKLKSAIVYCKTTPTVLQDNLQQRTIATSKSWSINGKH